MRLPASHQRRASAASATNRWRLRRTRRTGSNHLRTLLRIHCPFSRINRRQRQSSLPLRRAPSQPFEHVRSHLPGEADIFSYWRIMGLIPRSVPCAAPVDFCIVVCRVECYAGRAWRAGPSSGLRAMMERVCLCFPVVFNSGVSGYRRRYCLFRSTNFGHDDLRRLVYEVGATA